MKKESKWMSRKLWLYLILSIVGTIIWWKTPDTTFEEWASFLTWTTGIYMTANIGNHVSDGMEKKNGNNPEAG